jgi:hypothetical protein
MAVIGHGLHDLRRTDRPDWASRSNTSQGAASAQDARSRNRQSPVSEKGACFESGAGEGTHNQFFSCCKGKIDLCLSHPLSRSAARLPLPDEAKASDPKVDLHFWDPIDAFSLKESIVRAENRIHFSLAWPCGSLTRTSGSARCSRPSRRLR